MFSQRWCQSLAPVDFTDRFRPQSAFDGGLSRIGFDDRLFRGKKGRRDSQPETPGDQNLE
jgi:hypothetical protein